MIESRIRQFARFLFSPWTLYVAAWVLSLSIATGRLINARWAFEDRRPVGHPDRRIDGNNGHANIDFGGQWLMGRMLTSGHGKELYNRRAQRQVAAQAFPISGEAPKATTHDADLLLGWFMGTDEGDAVGGPLYPPIHAFLMAPFALGDHPQTAYFILQWILVVVCFVAGGVVHLLTRGRFWWPLATSLIFVFPGCKGAIDLGQNSPLTLLILLAGWALVVRGYPNLGGVVWGLLAYKPVWAISFWFALLLMKQWRVALIMLLTSGVLAAMTIPWVGIHSWFHWLKVGQSAAALYNVDHNWIHLSREVLGIPRRFFIDFHIPRVEREHFLARFLSWALWLVVLEIAIRVYFLRSRRAIPLTGPVPAFLFLTAWLCTYHFMYYDALIACFAVVVLLADPRPYLCPQRWTIAPQVNPLPAVDRNASAPLASQYEPSNSLTQQLQMVRSTYLNSLVLTMLGVLLLHENVWRELKVEGTAVIQIASSPRTISYSEGSFTEPSPRLILGTSDQYPWDTVVLMIIWLYLMVVVLRQRSSLDSSSKNA